MQTLKAFFEDDDSERYGLDTNEARLTIQFWYGLQKPDEILNLSALKLHTLPPLPDSVQILYCGNPNMVYIKSLPLHLKQLWAGNSQLRRLPPLPHSLTHLDISHTHIRTLPNLPTSLKLLYASSSSLECLPQLYTGIEILHLNSTPLKCIARIPESVKELNINSAQIGSLPRLPPRLRVLNMANTGIKVLPPLPVTLWALNVDVCPNLYIQRKNSIGVAMLPILESIPDYADRWLEWHDEQNRAKRYKIRHERIELELIETTWNPARMFKDELAFM